MSTPLIAVMDSMVGRPFVLLPGNPPDHKVLGFWNGRKVRARDVMTVWNDMLLMDAIKGKGSYARVAGAFERWLLSFGSDLYGCSETDAVERWLKLPKTFGPIEWGVEA